MPRNTNFNTYIFRLLAKISPSHKGLSSAALDSLNNLVKITIENLVGGINELVRHSSKKTISTRDCMFAVKLLLKGEITSDAVIYGEEKVKVYRDNQLSKKSSNESSSPKTRSELAELVFPISRIQNYMVNISFVDRKSDTSAVYLTAVCEYILTQIILLSVEFAEKSKKIRITPRHLIQAIKNNKDLDAFYKDCVFAGGIVAK